MIYTPSAESLVTLRAVSDADREFLVRLYGSTRDQELSQVEWPAGRRDAFVRMQFELQDVQYRTKNPHASFDVVEVAGRPAGRLYVDRRPDDIRVLDVALLPEHRGSGIGGRLLADVLDEAASTGRSVSLHVERHNRAAALYARLGFVTISEHGIHRLMEWRTP